MSRNSELYIGLMSGTSADAIDSVLVDFSDNKVNLLASSSVPFSPADQSAIHALADSTNCSLEQLGELDAKLGNLFAHAVVKLLADAKVDASDIAAIGSHGQTVRHRRADGANIPFSLQIGDANRIAETTGITTIADFRRRDIAAGGQGAPLVPAFHHWAMHSQASNRLIVNIGGMANITWLPASGEATGYDIGPGNVLMDAWIQQHRNQAFDVNGDWASSGNVDLALLSKLQSHPFLALAAPKSTGREEFNLNWLTPLAQDISTVDVQATLCEFGAELVAVEADKLQASEIYVCGGGAFNRHLMKLLAKKLPTTQVASTATIGIAPNWVEAIAFAWLARQTATGKSGNLCAVTGARRPVPLGAIYPGG